MIYTVLYIILRLPREFDSWIGQFVNSMSFYQDLYVRYVIDCLILDFVDLL